MSIHEILNRLEAEQEKFRGTEILAPIVRGRGVMVRVAGVVCEIKRVDGLPEHFRGWAVLRAHSTRHAEFMRAATMSESAQYRALFPAVRLILLERDGETGYALGAAHGDTRIRIDAPVRVEFCQDNLERFEMFVARFDGHWFWYDKRDVSHNPAIAAYLRAQFAQRAGNVLQPPADVLHFSGLTREEREAYNFLREALVRAQQDRVEERLREALAHSDAALLSYVERADAYVVRYQVDGQNFVSTIRRDDLSVLTAGICLSGQDARFDLTSLVGVLREGNESGVLVRYD